VKTAQKHPWGNFVYQKCGLKNLGYFWGNLGFLVGLFCEDHLASLVEIGIPDLLL
jgi:hypothetical protein